MPDLLHWITKFIDRNRWTALGLSLPFMALGLHGCADWDGKVVSSDTGRIVNAPERQQEFNAAIRTIEQEIMAQQQAIQAASAAIDAAVARAEAVAEDYEFDRTLIDNELAARANALGQIGELVKPLVATVPGGESVVNGLLVLLGLGGAGAAAGTKLDSRRKDKVIAEVKAKAKVGGAA